MSLIPKTTTDGGKTLILNNVQWSAQEDGHYTATATYAGTSSIRYATGYTVTANYTGEIAKTGCEIVTYTAIFGGTAAPNSGQEEEDASDLPTEMEPAEEKESIEERSEERATPAEEKTDAFRHVFPSLILSCMVSAASLGVSCWCFMKIKRENSIIVEKYDSVTGTAVPGATFRLRYLSGTSGTGGTVIGQKTTGTNGTAMWTGLKSGTYIVEEVSAPSGYSIIQSSETIYIDGGGEQTVITVPFYNAPDGSVLVKKIDSVTHAPLSDVEFLVTDINGTLIGPNNGLYTTNASGTILVDGVTPGTTLVINVS